MPEIMAAFFVWGLGVAVVGAIVLLIIGVVERELAHRRSLEAAERDVQRAAMRAAGENRHRTDIIA